MSVCCIISRMRNCLPKIASVFRSKATTNSNDSDGDGDGESDTERYIKVKSTKAKAAITKVESDQLIDNANKKPKQQQQQQLRPAAAAAAPAKATADDVDKKRLIRGKAGSSSVVKANEMDLEQLGRQQEGQLNSIRKEIKREAAGAATEAGKGGVAGTEGRAGVAGGAGVEAAAAVAAATGATSLVRPFPSNGTSTSKTPEQIELEYEANVAAEHGDIMTPLPRDPRPQGLLFKEAAAGAGSCGRTMQPEIVEAIRNLDTQALRLNNLTHEDRCRLTQSMTTGDEEDEAGTVLLRTKANPFDRQCHSLYERRLHKGPKLHLWVGNGKPPRPTPPSDDDDIKTFQVDRRGTRRGRGCQQGCHSCLSVSQQSVIFIYELNATSLITDNLPSQQRRLQTGYHCACHI